MIRIEVAGGEGLALCRSTAMTVELNNALFAGADVEGDVSFPFNLPVEGNERLLNFAHLPQAGGTKRLPCQVRCDGGLSWNGELVVQKTTRDTVTAALVINPYPDGFGSAKLTENQDGEIVISSTREAHAGAWAQFLAGSVHDPDVKFAPFFNQEGYGSANENYGYWNGESRRRIVNALFFDAAGAPLDSDGWPFSKTANRVFYPDDGDGSAAQETNQLAFCPQIRIARVFGIWCRNAGYALINHLGDDLNATFLQSQRSLDGTAAQYGQEVRVIRGDTGEVNLLSQEYPPAGAYLAPADTYSAGYIQNGPFSLPASGWWDFTADLDCVVKRPAGFSGGGWDEYVTLSVILAGRALSIDEMKEGTDAIEEWKFTLSEVAVSRTRKECRARVSIRRRLYLQGGNATGLRFHICAYHRNSKETRRIGSYRMTMEAAEAAADTEQSGFNIFRSKFRVPELLPDVTNSSFMKTILETMGLCYFVSARTKTIELAPYALMRGAGSLDLTDWELTRETETSEPEEKLRTFRLKPLKDEEYNEDLRLPDVETELPNAYSSHEHYVLRKQTNTLYRASVSESAVESWTELWEEHSGNPDTIEVGAGEEERREPAAAVPHQRLFRLDRRDDADTATGETPQLMVADFTVSSDLYNPSDTPSDIILTQYRGFRKRRSPWTAGGHVWNEVMLPVWDGKFSLTAKGGNSLGEKYVKPVLELLGHKTITYKLRLPADMLQPVEDLLRPSELPPERQTRFIVIRNVKTVPKKITFQIENDRDDTVLCQIEAVKVH